MNITLWEIVAHKTVNVQNRSFLSALFFYETASGGRCCIDVKHKKNEINIIEILRIIFDSDCFYGTDKKANQATPHSMLKSDEFAFLPNSLFHSMFFICENRMMYEKRNVEWELFVLGTVGWMKFEFSRYQRHDYKITVFHSSGELSDWKGKDQNEWCSSSHGVKLKSLLKVYSNYKILSQKASHTTKFASDFFFPSDSNPSN